MNQVIREKTLTPNVTLQIVKGDITLEEVDVIVNAANSRLMHGGGVAGAISRRGGPAIQEESHRIAPVPVGKAGITTAGKLPAMAVIHAVGPRWGEGDEHEKLREAVQSSLRLASEKSFKSISLPAISTGIFGFPLQEAVDVILNAIENFVQMDPGTLQTIRLCLFDAATVQAFTEKLAGT